MLWHSSRVTTNVKDWQCLYWQPPMTFHLMKDQEPNLLIDRERGEKGYSVISQEIDFQIYWVLPILDSFQLGLIAHLLLSKHCPNRKPYIEIFHFRSPLTMSITLSIAHISWHQPLQAHSIWSWVKLPWHQRTDYPFINMLSQRESFDMAVSCDEPSYL